MLGIAHCLCKSRSEEFRRHMDLLPFVHISAALVCGQGTYRRGLRFVGTPRSSSANPDRQCQRGRWRSRFVIAPWLCQTGRPAQRSSSAAEAHELFFDDHAGHALHFGEAAGEGGLVQRDDLLHGLFWQFLAGCWATLRGSHLCPSASVIRAHLPPPPCSGQQFVGNVKCRGPVC